MLCLTGIIENGSHSLFSFIFRYMEMQHYLSRDACTSLYTYAFR